MALAVTVIIWWEQNRSLNPEERLLFSKLDAAISQQPPAAGDVIAAFGLPDACRGRGCFLEGGGIGNLRFSGGNLRQPKDSADGLIFEIDGFSNVCIRSDRVETYFGTGEAEQSCSHGNCWYTRAQYPWGILTFGLSSPTAACVRSAVINSLPYQRSNS